MDWKKLWAWPGVCFAILLLGYAIYGMYVNELFIPTFRLGSGGVHFRNSAGVLMGLALIAASIWLVIYSTKIQVINGANKLGIFVAYSALSLFLLAYVWGEIFQYNTPEEVGYGGNEIAEYLIGGNENLKVSYVRYFPDYANFQYSITRSSALNADDKYKVQLGALFRERICTVEKELNIELVARVINVNVIRGGRLFISRTFDVGRC